MDGARGSGAVPARPRAGPGRGLRGSRLVGLVCGAAGSFLALAASARHRTFVAGADVHARPRTGVGRRAEGEGAGRPTARIAKVKERPVRPVATLEDERRATAIQPRSWFSKPAPPSLPLGLFRPKESLSQNFLADPNIIHNMVRAVENDSPNGRTVVELGPGTGALTSRLHPRFPEMIGIELDQRALKVLAHKVPGMTCIRSDLLLVDYTKLAELRGGPLTIVGNLPYHASTQLLFKLCDHASAVKTASVTMQKEVADRICARPRTKAYGIPSVAFQLYADCKKMFEIPPTAFFPRPNVMSAYVELDFESAAERRRQLGVDPRNLRNVTKQAFRVRNKKLGKSLMRLLNCHTTLIDELPLEYSNARAGQLEPWEYVHLTQLFFGKKEFPTEFRHAWRGKNGRTVRDDDV